mmetsp:Transcript_40924/g.46998  ORF Transcript_40924/g.46998 Transcript_40924/m.46998 type:complete len:700 (-) Transcript_40924:62-2161(-)
MNAMTKRLSHDYPYLQMRTYSSGDLADLGDKESCDKLQSIARYYIFVIGLKQLPLELRFGMCMPYECTPDLMNNAMSKMTDMVNELVNKTLASQPDLPLPTKVVPVLKFQMVSPDTWNEETKDDRAATSRIFGIFIATLLCFVVAGTVYENILQVPKKSLFKPNIDDAKLKPFVRVSEQVTLDSNREVKFSDNSGANFEMGNINLSDNEFTMTTKASVLSMRDISKGFLNENNLLHERPLFAALVSSFSLQVNLNNLTVTRRNKDEHPELEVIEGFRVLTMFWGIFCATSLYVLTAHVDNILRMLYLFKSITFTMCASGNLAPNLFLFFITFMSFYKIHKIMSKPGEYTVKTYFAMLIYRIWKYTPVYYFIFFFGWICLPYLSDAPTWYLSETLFRDCDKYWWSTLLYFNNFYPFFVEGLNGCFYWPFVIVCDLQLYLLLPVWVLVYKMNKLAFHALMTVLSIGGAILLFFVFYNNKLSVGVLTLENYYLYAYNFNKPYGKLPSVALGCWIAVFYINLLEYRKLTPDQKKEWKLMHFLHTSFIPVIVLGVWSAFALNFICLVPFEVNKDGYAWTTLQNSFYNALCQFAYVSSVMAILTLIFCGRLHILAPLLGMSVWRPLSKLTLCSYLVYPIVIMRLYVGLHESIYLGMFNIACYFLYNMIAAYLIALVVYLLIQGPMTNITAIVMKKLTPSKKPLTG